MLNQTASFDVDAQCCFSPLCPDELPVPEALSIVEALNEQARHARLRIGSKDAHSPNALWTSQRFESAQPGFDRPWPVHAVPGTPGFELLPGLPKPSQYDYFVWKGIELDMHPYGACYHDLKETRSTGVIEFLKVQKIQRVLVGGLALDYCVKTTALQLRRAGFEIWVHLPATRGIHPESVQKALAEMEQHGIRCCERLE